MNLFDFLLVVLAVFRLARIPSIDTVGEQARGIIGRMASGQDEYSWQWYLAELVNCQMCLGVWFSFLLVLLLFRKKSLREKFVIALAVAGGQNIIALLLSAGHE